MLSACGRMYSGSGTPAPAAPAMPPPPPPWAAAHALGLFEYLGCHVLSCLAAGARTSL